MADNNLFQFDNYEETAENETPKEVASEPAQEPETPPVREAVYDDESIQHLEWNEHIRRRPGMYIGKLGDGSHAEDGIYVLVKEVVDNSIDEFNMGAGKRIDITVADEGEVTIRDYGRGIPLGKVKEVASEINTGGKFDSKSFHKSVGLNGVGLKAVNALSSYCTVRSVRDGKAVTVCFEKGALVSQSQPEDTTEPNGTMVRFLPDNTLFRRRWSTTTHTSTPACRYTTTGDDTSRATGCSTCCART